ncbi:putative ester cyclase [Kibdelosporangium banguiense]|uniref:Ester cyclase n=1 Tax=Kibdelosporangium banguiense TaxID=1365924 RepID=A0ABS4TR38_9PSEU|nr:ester cyclase [Kibdelosporangium banguiense]MBP2326872.1 putative ester cyclase [Kibdelosporangium banguiense]
MRETPKDVARRFYLSLRESDLDETWERYVGPDAVWLAVGTPTRTAWLAGCRQLLQAFADFRIDVLTQVAEGNRVATRMRLSGTQTGVYHGIPPTGRRASAICAAFDLIEDGHIVEHWSHVDMDCFLRPSGSDVRR